MKSEPLLSERVRAVASRIPVSPAGLVLGISCAILLFSALISWFVAYNFDKPTAIMLVIKILSDSLLSASVVVLIFNALNQFDIKVMISSLFAQHFRETIVPIYNDAVSGSWSYYRFFCLIEPAHDDNVDWAVQHITIMHDAVITDTHIFVVGAMSEEDGIITEYSDKVNCLFRWRTTGNPNLLDIARDDVFRINMVRIDNTDLVIKWKDVTTLRNGRAQVRLGTVSLPKHLRDRQVTVQISATVRKYIGKDNNFVVTFELKKPAQRMESQLFLDPRIMANSISPGQSSISAFNPANNTSYHYGTLGNDKSVSAAYIIADFPVRRGTSPRFEVKRAAS